MSVRVHELAKTCAMTSKELLVRLKALKVPVKNHMSSLDQETAELVRQELSARLGQTTAPSDAQRLPAAAPVEVAKASPAVAATPSTATTIAEEAPAAATATPPQRQISVPVTVKVLADQLGEKPNELIKRLMQLRILATINQSLDEEIVAQLAPTYGFEIAKPPSAEEQLRQRFTVAPSEQLVSRAPVVTLMGHVDHGKTSLLDAIRETNVTAKETGGITQHIGAYEVRLRDKGSVTFLDTPGHEAFSAMRARGANVTDVVVLVVAADDGVMPQTVEAIDHAKAAGVPILVAINKIDKPDAEPERVKRELMQHDLTPEDWGGKTIMVQVSAKTGEGIEHLLEMLSLEAELLELKADPAQLAQGTVLEGKLSKGSGPLASVLVQNGTLRVGNVVLAGACCGRARALIDDRGHRIKEAGPSRPVEILGLQGVPEAGDHFFILDDEREARQLAEQRAATRQATNVMRAPRIALADVHKRIEAGSIKELKLVLKADVQGSLEALRANLEKLATNEVKLSTIHMGVGDINESDIMLAAASEAIAIGFHVGVSFKAQEQAIREGVEVRLYEIIYEATEEVRQALEGLLTPERKETLVGAFAVKQIFKVSKIGLVAGGVVTQGKIIRAGTLARVKRNAQVVFEGKLASLKRFKDDVREVSEGTECGMSVGGFTDVQAGDTIECYLVEEVARKL